MKELILEQLKNEQILILQEIENVSVKITELSNMDKEYIRKNNDEIIMLSNLYLNMIYDLTMKNTEIIRKIKHYKC
jgi:hypothetical protein